MTLHCQSLWNTAVSLRSCLLPVSYTHLLRNNNLVMAREIQYDINQIIYTMCACKGNMYAVIKEILKRNGLNIGSVRLPLTPLTSDDIPKVDECEHLIKDATTKYC